MNGSWNALDWLNDYCTVGLETALSAAYAAGVLALMVLVVNLVARRWLTASQMGLLWGLVLVRMAMPIAPGSQLSIHNLIAYLTSEPTATSVAVDPVAIVEPYAQPWNELGPATSEFSGAAAHYAAAQEPQAIENILMWVPLVWLAGVMFVLGSTLFAHGRFSRKISRCPACEDERLLALWQHCREEVQVTGAMPIVVCDEVSQPAVMGGWRPKLLLPPHCLTLSDAQLRMVMLHELMHVRCRDVAVNWLLVPLRAVQWWNPIFWLASARFVSLREQSRDAMVLHCLKMDAAPSRDYAELLLTLAGRGTPRRWRVIVPVSLLGFFSGWFRKRGVANRLTAIPAAAHTQRRWLRSAVAAVILAVGAVALTDAAAPEENAEPVDSGAWMQIHERAGVGFAVLPEGRSIEGFFADDDLAGPWTKRDYDVTAGVEIISRQKQCESKELPRLLKWDLVCLADPALPATAKTSDAAVEPEVQKRPRAELIRRGEKWVIQVDGPSTVHQRVQRTVRAWNRSGLGQVAIETRIATTQHDVMEAVGLTWQAIQAGPFGHQIAGEESDVMTPTGNPLDKPQEQPNISAVASVERRSPVMVASLSDEQTGKFIRIVQSLPRQSILFAPKVTLFNGQQGRIFSGVQRPFVTGLERREDGTVAPSINVVTEGFDLTLHSELNEGRTAIDLAATLDLCEITDVQTFATKLQGKEATVQVPSVCHVRVGTTACLQHHQTLLLCIPPTYDQKHYAWVLLTPRIIEEKTPLLKTPGNEGGARTNRR